MTSSNKQQKDQKPSLFNHKVPVYLTFEQIDSLLKAHLESFDRATYEKKGFSSPRFAEYVNLTSTLISAIASHPLNKEDN